MLGFHAACDAHNIEDFKRIAQALFKEDFSSSLLSVWRAGAIKIAATSADEFTLLAAIFFGKATMYNALVSAGLDLGIHRQRGLEIAAKEGHIDLIDMVKKSDSNLEKALIAGIDGHKVEVVKYLLPLVCPDAPSLIREINGLRRDGMSERIASYFNAYRDRMVQSYLDENSKDYDCYKAACDTIMYNFVFRNEPLFDVPPHAFRIILAARFNGPKEFIKRFLQVKYHALIALAALCTWTPEANTALQLPDIAPFARITQILPGTEESQETSVSETPGALAPAVVSLQQLANRYHALNSLIEQDVEFEQAASSEGLEQDAPHLATLIKELPQRTLNTSLAIAAQTGDKAAYLKTAREISHKRQEFGSLARAKTKDDQAFAQLLAVCYGHKDMFALLSAEAVLLTKADLQLALDMMVEQSRADLVCMLMGIKVKGTTLALNYAGAFKLAVHLLDTELLGMLTEQYPQQYITMRFALEKIAWNLDKSRMSGEQKKQLEKVISLLDQSNEQQCIDRIEKNSDPRLEGQSK